MTRAEHRADALGGQLEHAHVRRPRRRGEPQGGVQPGVTRVEVALAGRQLQAQLRQRAVEAVQARDEPARQQAAGTAEHERRVGAALLEFAADRAQARERLAAGIAQAQPGIGEFYAASVLAEQAQPEVLLKRADLPAHRAVGDVQLLGGLADAEQPGRRLEGAQGVQRGEFVGHGDT
ncbi:hypothetical protein D9M70_496150 [compost metagenome]